MLSKITHSINKLVSENKSLNQFTYTLNEAATLACSTFKPHINFSTTELKYYTIIISLFPRCIIELSKEKGKSIEKKHHIDLLKNIYKIILIYEMIDSKLLTENTAFIAIMQLVIVTSNLYQNEINADVNCLAWLTIIRLEIMNIIEIEFSETQADESNKKDLKNLILHSLIIKRNENGDKIKKNTENKKEETIEYLTHLVGLYKDQHEQIEDSLRRILDKSTSHDIASVSKVAHLKLAETHYKTTELLMPYEFIENNRMSVQSHLELARKGLLKREINVIYFYGNFQQYCASKISTEEIRFRKNHYSLFSPSEKGNPLQTLINEDGVLTLTHNPKKNRKSEYNLIISTINYHVKCLNDCEQVLNLFENGKFYESISSTYLLMQSGQNTARIIFWCQQFIKLNSPADLILLNAPLRMVQFIEKALKLSIFYYDILSKLSRSTKLHQAFSEITRQVSSALKIATEELSDYLKKLEKHLQESKTNSTLEYKKLLEKEANEKATRAKRLVKIEKNLKTYTIRNEKVKENESSKSKNSKKKVVFFSEFRTARAFFIEGDYKTCKEILENILTSQPPDSFKAIKANLLIGDALYQIAKLSNLHSDYDKSMSYYRKAKKLCEENIDLNYKYMHYYDVAVLCLSQTLPIQIKSDLIQETNLPSTILDFAKMIILKGYYVFVSGDFISQKGSPRDNTYYNLITFIPQGDIKKIFPNFTIKRTNSTLPIYMVELEDQTVAVHCYKGTFTENNLCRVAENEIFLINTLYLCLNDGTLHDPLKKSHLGLNNKSLHLNRTDCFKHEPEKIWYAIHLYFQGYSLSNEVRNLIKESYSSLKELPPCQHLSALNKLFLETNIKKIFYNIHEVEPDLLSAIFPSQIQDFWNQNSLLREHFYNLPIIIKDYSILNKNTIVVFISYIYICYTHSILKMKGTQLSLKKHIKSLLKEQNSLIKLPMQVIGILRFALSENFSECVILCPKKMNMYPQDFWIITAASTAFTQYKDHLTLTENLKSSHTAPNSSPCEVSTSCISP